VEDSEDKSVDKRVTMSALLEFKNFILHIHINKYVSTNCDKFSEGKECDFMESGKASFKKWCLN
jgi:hypothetical protein